MMIPKTIGRYRIKAELGRGGMSTVYLAHDPHFERDVAIKLLPLQLLHQSTFRRRFEREAKVVAALDHSAIVPVYDFGEENGQPFLVMRFMTGGTLADRLNQGALSIREAVYIISRLAPALDEVHSHGVIHRDLKPSNILFDQRNEPYLSDFGTAKITNAHTKLTDTGGAVGTPAYMSPEQIQGEAQLDSRSDIYTLGILLFEMLTGMHPYQTNTPIAVAVKHIFEPVPLILDMQPDLPPNFQEVIASAMAKNREDRYATAVVFAEALNKVVTQLAVESPAILDAPAIVPPGRRLALVISNSEFDDPTLTKLVRSTADVEELLSVLQDPEIGRFDEVTTLVNEPADVVRRAISHFFTESHRDDLLLLYFIGHAAVSSRGRLYLAMINTEHDLLTGTAIPATFIADEMDSSRSKQQILILDCHYSNAAATEGPGLLGTTVDTGAAFSRNGQQRIIVAAADSTEYYWSAEAVTGSAVPSRFTHYVIQGLSTGAADIDEDGRITVDELFTYVRNQLSASATGEAAQIPRKWSPFAYQEQGEIVIAQTPPEPELLPAPPPPPIAAAPDDTPPAAPAERVIVTGETAASWPKSWLVLGAILLLLLFFVSGGGVLFSGRPQGTVTAGAAINVPAAAGTATTTPTFATDASTDVPASTDASASATPTNTRRPLQTATPALARTASATPTEVVASATVTLMATATATPSLTPAPSATATRSDTEAIALLHSSLFAAPDAGAEELVYVDAGEEVTVIGRAAQGNWLYILTADSYLGYVYRPRFDWTGNFESLPIIASPDLEAP